VEFAYNNAPSTTTGVSPFFANKGYHPSITINSDAPLSSERAHSYVTDLAELHSSLHSEMSAAQSVTKALLMLVELHLQISKLEIKPLSKQNISAPLIL